MTTLRKLRVFMIYLSFSYVGLLIPQWAESAYPDAAFGSAAEDIIPPYGYGSDAVTRDQAEDEPLENSKAADSQHPCELLKAGKQKVKQGDLEAVLGLYQQALKEAKNTNNESCMAQIMVMTASLYRTKQDYDKALQFYQSALQVLDKLNLPHQQANCLNNMGGVMRLKGDVTNSIALYQQALEIRKKLGDTEKIASTQSNLGAAYFEQGLYAKAIDYYQQAQRHLQDLDKPNPKTLGALLNNLGLAMTELGDYERANEVNRQVLSIRTETNDRSGIAQSLHNMGFLHYLRDEPEKALELFEQALRLRKKISDLSGQAETLNTIGVVQSEKGQVDKALVSLNSSLELFQKLHNHMAEGRVLDSLGSTYKAQRDYIKALEIYQSALTIAEETQDRNAQRITLGNMGAVLEQQNDIALAIVFYKRSVNVSEAMRQALQPLPVEQRKSYAQAIADNYRKLADLLLRQDRVLEAQRVLDLLKVQEAQDYLGKVRGTEGTAEGVPTLDPEKSILEELEQRQREAIEVGKRIVELRTLENRTTAQDSELTELVARQIEISRAYVAFLKSPEIRNLAQQLERTDWDQTPQMLKRLRNLSDNLQALEQNAVLLYPLVLKDRLELVLATAVAPPIHLPVAVDHKTLNETILAFRNALRERSSTVTETGKRLYAWLIAPLETALKETDAKTILYAPDGQLRYIPLAALHDGENWMAQRFRINNITAVSLTDLSTRPAPKPKLLAAAFTQGHHTVEAGTRTFDLYGLRFAGKELAAISATMPDSSTLLDDSFSPDRIIPRMDDYTIIHLATHAAMVPEDPDESFILFGDGKWVTLRDVESWYLTNVDLIVLSACETGLGERLGNGEEILGFGYRLEEAGARASIASLWSVDDGGTEALMTAFYAALSQPGTSKVEALRKAQLALISDDYTPLEDSARGVTQLGEKIRSDVPAEVVNQLSHPYYWSPFILIGNGL